MIGIYYLSSQPGEWIVKTISFTAKHDWGHLVAYFALGAAICWGLLQWGIPAPWKTAFYFTWLYGLTDELHQLRIPGRDFEFTDLLADGIGALVGVLFVKSLSHRLKAKEKSAAQTKDDRKAKQ